MPDQPAPHGNPPGPIRFPSKPNLFLPSAANRGRSAAVTPYALANASAETRRQIGNIIRSTRTPWGDPNLSHEQVRDFERTLRQLETKLAEAERDLDELRVKLADKEREQAETEALLIAREKVLTARSVNAARPAESPAATAAEMAALESLKAELERQEASFREAKAQLKEREEFIESSETALFAKVQAQQEKETELEQREEELLMRAQRLQEREAVFDPTLAASLDAEKKAPPPPRDEFNE